MVGDLDCKFIFCGEECALLREVSIDLRAPNFLVT